MSTTGEELIKELKKQTNILAEISNQQLEIIDKLQDIKINTLNSANNTKVLNTKINRNKKVLISIN